MTGRLSAFLAAKGLQLRRLDGEHYVNFFECGRDEDMNQWFVERAMKWQDEDMCAVWVLSPADDETAVMGFFTLSAHQIVPSNVHRHHKAASKSNKSWVNNLQQPLPAQLLGKFALGESYQGKNLGHVLMACVYAKHVEAADAAGAKFLVLDVQEDGLVTYYSREFGFERSGRAGETAQMYRPTSVIRKDLDAVLKSS